MKAKNNKEIVKILSTYKKIGKDIQKKFSQFRKIGKRLKDKEIFKELCFCILTVQSKAENCWKCIESLDDANLLEKGSSDEVMRRLKGVRFHKNKAKRIIEARSSLQILVRMLEYETDSTQIRQWLVENVNGLGMKEATHFLRNIGKADNLAILDRHILRRLHKLGIIEKIPESLSIKNYLEIEKKMQIFAESIKIPVNHLDFVFWYQETGRIFK
ncbi:MAG TPA: N-glycosylase/DNA lyase [bacterium]|nr:N-glycosylase/DNA lyase [bacterium]HOL35338.1 N-glycosylase/DNA lyase [bacterium]HPP08535.1 N-glycosylase/DNA lyase [bacterium]